MTLPGTVAAGKDKNSKDANETSPASSVGPSRSIQRAESALPQRLLGSRRDGP